MSEIERDMEIILLNDVVRRGVPGRFLIGRKEDCLDENEREEDDGDGGRKEGHGESLNLANAAMIVRVAFLPHFVCKALFVLDL